MKRLCTPAKTIPLLSRRLEIADRVRPLKRWAKRPFATEWRLVRNQGGTVEYIIIICIPPLIMSGVGFFIFRL